MSARPELRAFVQRTILFLLPVAVIATPLEWGLWRIGETATAEQVVERQQATPGPGPLYGRRLLSQQFNVYKLAGVRYTRPQILAVGSSRVMQLRHEHFGIDRRFYNAGGMIQSWNDLVELLDMLQDGRIEAPEALILQIDPWWFTTQREPPSWLRPAGLRDVALQPGAHVAAYDDLIAVQVDWAALMASPFSPNPSEGIGMAGRAGDGFRADGSRRYGTHLREFACRAEYRDRETPPIIDRAKHRTHQFEHLIIDPSRQVHLVERLKQLPYTVVVVLAPISEELHSYVTATPELASWWHQHLEFGERLRVEGVHVVSVSHPKQVGAPATSMFDGFHPSEVLWARIMPRIADALPEHLRPTEDAWNGQELARAAPSPLSMVAMPPCVEGAR